MLKPRPYISQNTLDSYCASVLNKHTRALTIRFKHYPPAKRRVKIITATTLKTPDLVKIVLTGLIRYKGDSWLVKSEVVLWSRYLTGVKEFSIPQEWTL